MTDDLSPQKRWEAYHNDQVDMQAKEAITHDHASLYQNLQMNTQSMKSDGNCMPKLSDANPW